MILRKNQNVVDRELQWAITPTKLASSSNFSIINVHLVDTNAFAKFDEIPSMPVQVIKEKPKCNGLRITKGNNSKRVLALFFYYKCSSCEYQCVCQIWWNSVIAFSRYWKTKSDGRENSILPTNTVCRGYNDLWAQQRLRLAWASVK